MMTTPEMFSEVLDALYESLKARRRIEVEEVDGTPYGLQECEEVRDEADGRTLFALREFLVPVIADVAQRAQT